MKQNHDTSMDFGDILIPKCTDGEGGGPRV